MFAEKTENSHTNSRRGNFILVTRRKKTRLTMEAEIKMRSATETIVRDIKKLIVLSAFPHTSVWRLIVSASHQLALIGEKLFVRIDINELVAGRKSLGWLHMR